MKKYYILYLLVSAFLATPAYAGGFALEQQNAAAMGVAYAGAQARSGDAGFAYYNPAAIGHVDSLQISLNAAYIIPDANYNDASNTLLGAFPTTGRAADDGALDNALVPNISVAYPLTEKIVIGAVVNAPFGLNSEFSRDSVIRFHALETDVKTISVAPHLAVEFLPGVTLGASVRFQFLDFEATNAIDAGGIAFANSIPGFTPGASDAFSSLDGTDWAVGFAFGVQAALNDRLTAGASYSSKIDHNFNGDANFDLAPSVAGQTLTVLTGLFAPTTFTSKFVTPASAQAGAIFDATDRLSVMTSVVFTRWSEFEGVTATFANPAQPPEILTQDWDDSWAFSVGAEYDVTKAVRIRAGVMYDDSPVNGAFASPRIPDEDRFWVNAGLSYDIQKNLTVDGGIGFVFVDDLSIDNASTLPENLFRGDLTTEFDTTGLILSLRLNYRMR